MACRWAAGGTSRCRVGLPRRVAQVAALCAASSVLSGAGALCAEVRPPDRNWAVSVFLGALTHNDFNTSLYTDDLRLADDYLAGVDLTRTLYRVRVLPIDLELDVTAATRFGTDHQWDFGIIPMARWKAFPWNKYVYTNVRLGLVGVDFVTGVSPWERHWAGNDHGSELLNYLAFEVDLKPAADSRFEWYVGSHHRSGIFGLINNTWGGSTYWDTGLRYRF